MPFNDLDTPQKYKDFEERWEWILTYMVLEDMFVHEILMMMEKRPCREIETMGVKVEDARLILVYNPNFVHNLSDPELRWVVTHEIYHVVLHHVTVRLPARDEDRMLYNIAADMAINCLIPTSPSRTMPLHKDGPHKGEPLCLLPTRPPYCFPDKLSKEQYVLLLREKGVDKGSSGGKSPGGKKGAKNDGDDEGKGAGSVIDSHDGWSDADAEVVKQEIRNKIEQISKRESSGWGNLPGDVQGIIMAAQRSSIRWWRYLRHFFGDIITSRSESTFKKPNRRFGYPYCGTKRLHTDRKLVAIDRSGSCMSTEDQAHFLAEVNKLSEIQPVDIVSFDVGIHGKVRPFDRKHIRFEYQGGGGGTSFQEVFDLAEQRGYQSLIILTDGEANEPTKPKRVKDVIWVLTDPSKNPPVEWGKRVHIVPKGVSQPS